MFHIYIYMFLFHIYIYIYIYIHTYIHIHIHISWVRSPTHTLCDGARLLPSIQGLLTQCQIGLPSGIIR